MVDNSLCIWLFAGGAGARGDRGTHHVRAFCSWESFNKNICPLTNPQRHNFPKVSTCLEFCVRQLEEDAPCVVYGMIGTKSLAMTVMLWPSRVNFWIPSAPALINRSRCTLPGVNLKTDRPALFLHFVVSPGATVEQLKSPFPLIRLLSEDGPYLPFRFSFSSMPKL
jgi:hypothetical protein